MTGVGPTDQRPHPSRDDGAPADPVPAASPADRSRRLTAANMVRSLLPLLVIVLVVVGWTALRQSQDVDPVREIDPSSTVQLAAARAGYPLRVPTGLPGGYRPTSARTDAGDAGTGDPVTLEIGYVTPTDRFAGFVESDDPGADPVTAVLAGARQRGSVQVGGQVWTRSTTKRGETALSRQADGVVLVVTGSAPDPELTAVAAALRPFSG